MSSICCCEASNTGVPVQASDAGRLIKTTSGSPVSITVPAGLAFNAMASVRVVPIGSGAVTFVEGDDVSVLTPETLVIAKTNAQAVQPSSTLICSHWLVAWLLRDGCDRVGPGPWDFRQLPPGSPSPLPLASCWRWLGLFNRRRVEGRCHGQRAGTLELSDGSILAGPSWLSPSRWNNGRIGVCPGLFIRPDGRGPHCGNCLVIGIPSAFQGHGEGSSKSVANGKGLDVSISDRQEHGDHCVLSSFALQSQSGFGSDSFGLVRARCAGHGG